MAQIAAATSPPVQLSAVTMRSDRSRASSMISRARVSISSENIGRPPGGRQDPLNHEGVKDTHIILPPAQPGGR